MNPARAYLAPPSAPPSHAISLYWRWWAISVAVLVIAAIAGFLIVEFWMLASGRPQDTLSAQVWRLINVTPGPVDTWTAVRVLTLIVWLTAWLFIDLTAAWLTGHFWMKWWR